MVVAPITVPFLDLRPTHEALRDALLTDIGELLDSGGFINGPAVREFERAFADFVGRSECVGAASGLDALRLGLIAAGLEPGDEVIVPANTFVATFEAVAQARGRPVPVDVSWSDLNLDCDAVAAAIGPRTRALLPVHLYGQLADMSTLAELARRHGLLLVEDACQAHGATRDSHGAGGSGFAAAFSFYPAKNLGALGDAGALIADDPELIARVRALREHGQYSKYQHVHEGYTARLDTIQALALLRKLPLLATWNEQRRAAAALYLDGLGDLSALELPPVPEGSEPVWHLFVIRVPDPDALASFLAERGVATGRHYPEPPHLSAAYARLEYGPGSFPVAERLAETALSLPIYPGITETQVGYVVEQVRAYVDG